MNNAEQIFSQLKAILVEYAEDMVLVKDEQGHYYLDTHHVMKNKKNLYFGSAKIAKNYVSFHLMPVYMFPELLNDISPALKKRMQGKSCFNFKHTDLELFSELKALTHSGFKKLKKENYI
jgi:hypothetical protein